MAYGYKAKGDLNSDRFSNLIKDGFRDLISGALGIRTSRGKKISDEAERFRKRARKDNWKSNLHKDPSKYLNIQESAMLVFPERQKTDDGGSFPFSNYVHFRSLQRRAGEDGENRYDIFLYVPDNLNDNLEVAYGDAEVNLLDSVLANFINTDQVEKGWPLDRQEAEALAVSMAPGGKMIQSAQGRGINPLKYKIFEGVNFRTFSYTFTLRPKNEHEAKTIREILYAFKWSALPGSKGSNQRIYTFPNEWNIQFQGQIKNWVDAPLVSVCTGVNVDYAGGQPMALMTDGAPSSVTLTVNFMETTTLTRGKFSQYSAAETNGWQNRGEDFDKGTTINHKLAKAQKQLNEERKKATDNKTKDITKEPKHELWPGHAKGKEMIKEKSDEINARVPAWKNLK